MKTRIPRFFPAVVALCLLLAGGVLSELFVRQERERLQHQTVQEGLQRLYALRARIESELISTLYLASGVEAFIRADRGEVQAEEMRRVLAILYGNSHAIRNIGIAPGNRISHVYPLAGNERAIGLYYPDNPQQWPAIEKVIRQRSPFLAGPVKLVQGGEGLIYRVPVFLDDGRYWGLISTVLDSARLWQRVGLDGPAGQRISILGKDAQGSRGEPVFGELRSGRALSIDIAVPGGNWRLQEYEPVTPARAAAGLPLRLAGWLLSAVLAAGLFFVLQTARRLVRLNAELEASRDAAEEANRARTAFFAVMSHEVRTPLNGVMGMTQLLCSASLSPVLADHAQTARNCAETLLGIMDDILDFSLIDSGALQLKQQRFALIPLLEDAAEPFALKARDKGLEFSWIFSPSLPAEACGDPVRLRQIIAQLLSNAVKFTGGGAVTLSAAPDELDSRSLHLIVRDTGIGIHPEEQARLFEPFAQLDSSSTRRFGGTGLGLSLCHRLLGLMGGRIEVDSQLGQGASFHVHLPLDLGGAQPLDALLWPSNGRVMLVSPDSGLSVGLEAWLRAWGATISVLADGQEALTELDRLAALSALPDLLIVDSAAMPGGEALLIRLAQDGKLQGSACIRLLAPGACPDVPSGSGYRRTMVLSKPVRADSLARVLRELFTPPPPVSVVVEARSATGGWRILLVEDNIINQKVALAMLGLFGLQADTALNGCEALTALSRSDYDLVLMDLQMPEMDGLEATRQIRDPASGVRRHDLPVVALTANALEVHREECLAAGMNDYLSKPLAQEQLRVILQRYLRGFASSSA